MNKKIIISIIFTTIISLIGALSIREKPTKHGKLPIEEIEIEDHVYHIYYSCINFDGLTFRVK